MEALKEAHVPLTIEPPKKVALMKFVCDRCGKTAELELATLPSGEISEVDAIGKAPEGWRAVRHPENDSDLFFDRRDCMGVWFSTFVRVLYGGPEELPKRRRKSSVESIPREQDVSMDLPLTDAAVEELGVYVDPTADTDFGKPVSPKREKAKV